MRISRTLCIDPATVMKMSPEDAPNFRCSVWKPFFMRSIDRNCTFIRDATTKREAKKATGYCDVFQFYWLMHVLAKNTTTTATASRTKLLARKYTENYLASHIYNSSVEHDFVVCSTNWCWMHLHPHRKQRVEYVSTRVLATYAGCDMHKPNHKFAVCLCTKTVLFGRLQKYWQLALLVIRTNLELTVSDHPRLWPKN